MWQSDFLLLSLCFQDDLTFALYFVQLPGWNRFELLPFLVHCCFRIRNVHRLRHRNNFVNQIKVSHRIESSLSDVIFMLSGKSRFQTISCRFTRFYDTWILCHSLDSVIPRAAVSCSLLKRFLVSILQGMTEFIGTSNFFLAFFDGFLVLAIFRINEVNSSQFSSIVRLCFFTYLFLLFLLLSCFFDMSIQNFRPQIIRSGSCLDLRMSPPTPRYP